MNQNELNNILDIFVKNSLIVKDSKKIYINKQIESIKRREGWARVDIHFKTYERLILKSGLQGDCGVVA